MILLGIFASGREVMILKQNIPLHKIFGKWVVPRFDELTLFIMSFTAVLLFVVDDVFRKDVFWAPVQTGDITVLLLFTLMVSGLVLSLVESFVDHQRHKLELFCMLAFTIYFQGGTAIAAGVHMLPPMEQLGSPEYETGFFWIFPIWNFLNGLYLMLVGPEALETGRIAQREAETSSLVITSVLILLIVLVLYQFFSFHWTLSASILVAFASIVTNVKDALNAGLSS